MDPQNEVEVPEHRVFTGSKDYDAEYSSDSNSFAEDRFGLYVFTVAGCVALAVVVLLTIREFYLNKYNFEIFPCLWYKKSNRRQSSTPSHLASDREMAEELQRRLNEEDREAERMRKRSERKEWYQSYLKPFTMTAKKDDFFYAHEMEGESNDAAAGGEEGEDESKERCRTMSTSELTIEEEDDEADMELGDSSSSDDEPILCGEDADDAHLYLRLPVFKHAIQRSVDAHCAICFSEYEENDEVVWSNLECKHAFHKECIMPWLAKGKKRCPICRHWFVPGARIEDQKKALAAQLETGEDSSAETDVTTSSASGSTFNHSDTPMTSRDLDVSNNGTESVISEERSANFTVEPESADNMEVGEESLVTPKSALVKDTETKLATDEVDIQHASEDFINSAAAEADLDAGDTV